MPADADTARGLAEEILARPEYQEPSKSFLQRALDWVGEQLDRLFTTVSGTGGGSVIAWLIIVALGVLVALLVVRVVRQRTRAERRAEPSVRTRRAGPRTSAQEWRRRADELEAAGDWRGAMRCRYRALVADLTDREVLGADESRTTGEQRRQVDERAPAAAGDFAAAAELFDRSWYGRRRTGPDEAARIEELAGRVREEVRR